MTIPSRDEIVQSILNTMQTSLKDKGVSLSLSPKTVWHTLAVVLAQALILLYHFSAWGYRQIFPQTQDEASLLMEGERFGLFPKLATRTQVEAQASGTVGSVISAGQQASVQGELFEVQASVELDANGVAAVVLLSLSYGELMPAASLTLTRAVVGVNNDLEVVEWLSGSDAENLVDFRNRVVSIRRNRPQGGAISDYLAWSLQVPGIVRVMVLSKQPGFVVVFPIIEQIGDARIPSEEKRLELEEHLNQEDLAPLGVAGAMVGIFTELVVNVEVVGIYPAGPDLKSAIQDSWQLYLWQRFPKQFAAQEGATQVVSKAEMLALAVSSGATQIDITLFLNGQPVQVIELAYNQIIELGDVQWS